MEGDGISPLAPSASTTMPGPHAASRSPGGSAPVAPQAPTGPPPLPHGPAGPLPGIGSEDEMPTGEVADVVEALQLPTSHTLRGYMGFHMVLAVRLQDLRCPATAPAVALPAGRQQTHALEQ